MAKKSKNKNKVKNTLDKLVSEFREKKLPQGFKKQLITFQELTVHLNEIHEDNYCQNALRNWNLNYYLPFKYDSIEYKPYKGFIIKVEEFVEERKKEKGIKTDEKEEG